LKTILSIFTAMLLLGFCSTIANTATTTLSVLEGKGPRTKDTIIQQSRKQSQTPPAKQQTQTRADVKPVLKSSSPFKPLTNDDRKGINDPMAPVN